MEKFTPRHKKSNLELLIEASKKRPIYAPVSPKELLGVIAECDDLPAQALTSFLYVAGPRINEATQVRRRDIRFSDSEIRIELKTLKKREYKLAKRTVSVPLGELAKCYENVFAKYVRDYISEMPGEQEVFALWGNMSSYLRKKIPEITLQASKFDFQERYWKEITLKKPLHPHFLRHCRASHLVDYYDFDVIDLIKFFDWDSAEMAILYVKSKHIRKKFGLPIEQSPPSF